MISSPKVWKVEIISPRASLRPSVCPTRSFISRAALLVKVTAAIWRAWIAAAADQVGDFIRNNAGLTGTGARQHRARSGDEFDGLLLAGLNAWESCSIFERGGDCSRKRSRDLLTDGKVSATQTILRMMSWQKRSGPAYLVKEEKLALEILAKLERGVSFDHLAKRYSKCPSGTQRRRLRRVSARRDGRSV